MNGMGMNNLGLGELKAANSKQGITANFMISYLHHFYIVL